MNFVELWERCAKNPGSVHVSESLPKVIIEKELTFVPELVFPNFYKMIQLAIRRKAHFITEGQFAPCGSYIVRVHVEPGFISPEDFAPGVFQKGQKGNED